MIDWNVTLPTQPSSITGGAGRGNVTAQAGSTVLLFCPSTSRPAAMITWQRSDGGNLMAVDAGSVTSTVVEGIPTALLTLNNIQLRTICICLHSHQHSRH